MTEYAQRLRETFMQTFLSERENPDTVLLRQNSVWQRWLEYDPHPEASLRDLRGGAGMRTPEFVARAFGVMLAPRADILPFYVPPKAVLLGKRSLDDFGNVFSVSATRLCVCRFAAEVLVIGHVAAEEKGFLTEALTQRYALLFPRALRFFSQGNSLAQKVLDRQERNEVLRGHYSVR